MGLWTPSLVSIIWAVGSAHREQAVTGGVADFIQAGTDDLAKAFFVGDFMQQLLCTNNSDMPT